MMKDISTTSGQVPFLPFHFSGFYSATYLPKSNDRPVYTLPSSWELCTIPLLDCMLVLLLMMTLTSDR